ncbi:hypothetical protein CPB86DRAFT_790007 [Serendipita vermifera]|nr:hypothetical protein CPB86DRAFT_790007 [Serendipita vermifera]
MTMDPFEAHMKFVNLLKKLNASQPSIQKVVEFALQHYAKCGEDFWDCIVQECEKASVNMRINLLYFIDSLCEASALAVDNDRVKSSSSSTRPGPGLFYVNLLQRDLEHVVLCAVPASRDGLMNIQSTLQILENWRTKRVIDPKKVDHAIGCVQERKNTIQKLDTKTPSNGVRIHSLSSTRDREEALRRIEEDRERHKILRERRWVQRIDRSNNAQPILSCFLPNSLPRVSVTKSVPPTPTDAMETEGASASQAHSIQANREQEMPQLAIDIEFENAWETTSDWNEDDIDAVFEEYSLCFPGTPPKKPIL